MKPELSRSDTLRRSAPGVVVLDCACVPPYDHGHRACPETEAERTTMVSVRTTPHPVRSKRIPLGDIVNAHMMGVNLDRPTGGSRLSPLPLLQQPHPPSARLEELEEIAGRSIGVDIENVIVHMEPVAMSTTRISVFPASTPASRHTGVK
ncbi:hypothetical protein WMF38_54085 [Sorangium sp. So ce118]